MLSKQFITAYVILLCQIRTLLALTQRGKRGPAIPECQTAHRFSDLSCHQRGSYYIRFLINHTRIIRISVDGTLYFMYSTCHFSAGLILMACEDVECDQHYLNYKLEYSRIHVHVNLSPYNYRNRLLTMWTTFITDIM